MQAPKHVVYVLKSAHQPPHYYVGVTAAPADRLADHNAGRCPQCGEPKAAHRVCAYCGHYRARQVRPVDEE